MTKEQKKAQRGQNKARKFGKVRDDFDLCWKIANGSVCEYGDGLSFFQFILFWFIEYSDFLTGVDLRTTSRRILQRKHTIFVFQIALNSQIHHPSLHLKNPSVILTTTTLRSTSALYVPYSQKRESADTVSNAAS